MIQKIIIGCGSIIGIILIIAFVFFSDQIYKYYNTIFEAKIFENSYQRKNTINTEKNLYKAQLIKINELLKNDSISEKERQALEARKSFIEVRIIALDNINQ